MAINNVNTTTVPRWYQTDRIKNIKLSAGTYVAIVKNSNDPEKHGRLQVWLPDLGGDENNPKHWLIVRYASPFMGQTNTRGLKREEKNKKNQFAETSSTYGMWMVPPDKGNSVLVTFANSDPNRGFWFACIIDRRGHNMIPGIAGGTEGAEYDRGNIDDGATALKGAVQALGFDDKLPLGEFNEYDPNTANQPVANIKKTLHSFQAPHYIEQGLTADPVRGPSSSSSQRDVPSSVYGISTPGRPANDPGAANPGDPANFAAQNRNRDNEIYQRVGGHTFVMDDGDFSGQNNQIRLRSSNGHQILLDDTTGTFYMINASGTGWFEMNAAGFVSVYASSGMNIRARGDINMHADKNFRIFGKESVFIRTDGDMIMEGKREVGLTGGQKLTIFGDQECNILSQKGTVNIESGTANGVKQPVIVNSSGDIVLAPGPNSKLSVNPTTHPTSVKPPPGLKEFKHNDTTWLGYSVGWRAQKFATTSIVAVLPTHEPWDRNGYNLTTAQSLDTSKEAIPHWTTGGDNINAHGEIVNIQPTLDENGKVVATVTARDGTVAQVTLDRLKGLALAENVQFAGGRLVVKSNDFSGSTLPGSTRGLGDHLTASDTLSLLVGLAKSESGGAARGTVDQFRVNPDTKALGILQFTAPTLETLGYLKPGSYASYGYDAVYRADAWRFNGGVDAFLNNRAEQWSAGMKLLEFNYNVMVKNGTIQTGMEPSAVAGLLGASWIAGAGGATNMARSGYNPSDSNKTSTMAYYALGKAAYTNKWSDLFGR